MRGALHLFPLYLSTDDSIGSGGAAATTAVQVQEERVHPISMAAVTASATTAMPETPSRSKSSRLATILASVQSDIISKDDHSNVINPLKLQKLPRWAQDVVRSGCFEGHLDKKSVFRQSLSHRSPPSSGTQKRMQNNNSESQQKKRPRSSTEESPREPGEIDDGDGNDDDEVHLSQGSYAGDECPPRTLFTSEERVAGTVEKYSDQFIQLLDQLHYRQQSGAFQRDGIDLLTHAEVRALLQTLKIMRKRDMIGKVDLDLLITLMGSLDKQVLRGIGLDILGTMTLSCGDEEWKASGINARLISRMQLCLDVSVCELLILSTREIDRRVLSEETIDNCIQLFNHVVQRLIVPCIDSAAAASAVPAEDKNDLAHEAESHASSPKSRARYHNRRSSASFNIRTNREIRSAMAPLVNVACEFIEQLSKLVLTVKLADRWILHFSSSMVELFLLEHSVHATSLQQSAMAVLRGVFLQYEPHRSLILEEIVGVMKKLPTSKRHLRTVKLLDSSSNIQMVTTLVVALVQSSSSIWDIEKENASRSEASERTLMPAGEDPDSEAKEFQRRVEDTRQNAGIFIRALMKECLKKHEERDYRVVLENFVEDLLVMFVRPEWAGAEILLEVLSSSLASILHSSMAKDAKKLESQHTLAALNLIGKICTSIKMYQNTAARDVLEEDVDARLVLEDHERFLRENFVATKCEDGPSQQDLIKNNVILKHVLMVSTRRGNRVNIAQDDSRRLLLARFIADSCPGFELKSSRDFESSLWKSFWQNSPRSVDSTSKLLSPSSNYVQRLSLHLVVTREFCCLFDKLLAHVMSLLSRGIPTFRARVLKILAGVVDVDPMLMVDGGVRAAVNRCFMDEGTSVRQAAVDLVGRHVALQPLLFDRYFDMLAERLRDKGISVRKSVCKIFRTFLTSSSHENGEDGIPAEGDLRRKSACMRSLVERIGDPSEELVMKNFIIDTFQEVWFGSEFSSRQLSSAAGEFAEESAVADLPPGWKTVETNPGKDDGEPQSTRSKKVEFLSPDGKAFCSLDEAWSVYRTPQVTPSSVVKSKQSKLDDTPEMVITIVEVIHDMSSLDWFVALLKRLLQEDDREKAANGGTRFNRDRSDEVKIAKVRSEKIVEYLVECLLQLEEGTPLKGVTIGDEQMQFLACMKTLSAFCEARPLLMYPHLELIMIHLKGDDSLAKAVENKVQSLVLSMINNVFAQMERIPERLVKRLEGDVKSLMFRAPPSVVGPSIKCLATIATTTRKPPILLVKLLETFYSYLLKCKDLDSLASIPTDVSSSLQRALFTAGQVGGAIDLDACVIPDNELAHLKKGAIMDSLYDTFVRFLNMKGNPTCAAKAAQGLGFLFLTRTRLLLQAQQDGILDFMLYNSGDEMKLQCLTSLTELLKFEERRLEQGSATKTMNNAKSKKEQVQGDQEADAALIGSVMQAQIQNILALSLAKSVRIRTEAIVCIDTLLTQGLVSPLHCIPNLVALETDQVVLIRDLAHSQLVALNDKFPTLLNTPSLQGIQISYSFQLSAFGSCSVYTLDKDKREYCLFGRLYSDCIRAGRMHRNLFLKALVNQFADSGGILSTAGTTRASSSMALKDTINYLCYLAQLLCALPYEVEDEPLYIIYLINRYVTLKLGTTLDGVKELFANAGLAPDIMADEDTDFSEVDVVDYLPAVHLSDCEARTLQEECVAGFAISLLIRAKFFLKEMYLLDNEKCITYQPTNSSKATDHPAMLSSDRASRLRLPSLSDIVQTENPVELSWRLFLSMWEAARDDQHQMDFEVQEDAAGKLRKTKGRRRKSVQAKHRAGVEDDDDNEIVEGFAG